MSTRSEALQWLKSQYGAVDGPVCTSKFYEAEESWTKSRVWWLQVPVRYIEEDSTDDIHLLCRAPLNGQAYHYLKVPAAYFREHRSKLGFTNESLINLHLSAEPGNMFEDERGKGKLSFRSFLVPNKHS